MLLGRLGRMAAEIGVGTVVDNRVGNSVLFQGFIQIPATGSVERINRNLADGSDCLEIDLAF